MEEARNKIPEGYHYIDYNYIIIIINNNNNK